MFVVRKSCQNCQHIYYIMQLMETGGVGLGLLLLCTCGSGGPETRVFLEYQAMLSLHDVAHEGVHLVIDQP
jgi:hypothetical protein